MPLSQLSVSTISTAYISCTCARGHQSVLTLMLTAFERKIISYNDMINPKGKKIENEISTIVSSTKAYDKFNIKLEDDELYSVNNRNQMERNNLSGHNNERSYEIGDENYEEDFHTEIETVTETETETETESGISPLGKSKGKWIFPPPPSQPILSLEKGKIISNDNLIKGPVQRTFNVNNENNSERYNVLSKKNETKDFNYATPDNKLILQKFIKNNGNSSTPPQHINANIRKNLESGSGSGPRTDQIESNDIDQ